MAKQKKSAQEIQDSILRKMSADRRVRLAFSLSRLVVKLSNKKVKPPHYGA